MLCEKHRGKREIEDELEPLHRVKERGGGKEKSGIEDGKIKERYHSK